MLQTGIQTMENPIPTLMMIILVIFIVNIQMSITSVIFIIKADAKMKPVTKEQEKVSQFPANYIEHKDEYSEAKSSNYYYRSSSKDRHERNRDGNSN